MVTCACGAGMKQAGVAEAIFQSVSSCARALQPLMYSNIILVGGNTLLPNYTQRVYVSAAFFAGLVFVCGISP